MIGRVLSCRGWSTVLAWVRVRVRVRVSLVLSWLEYGASLAAATLGDRPAPVAELRLYLG